LVNFNSLLIKDGSAGLPSATISRALQNEWEINSK
jgi:hypothetical protein